MNLRIMKIFPVRHVFEQKESRASPLAKLLIKVEK